MDSVQVEGMSFRVVRTLDIDGRAVVDWAQRVIWLKPTNFPSDDAPVLARCKQRIQKRIAGAAAIPTPPAGKTACMHCGKLYESRVGGWIKKHVRQAHGIVLPEGARGAGVHWVVGPAARSEYPATLQKTDREVIVNGFTYAVFYDAAMDPPFEVDHERELIRLRPNHRQSEHENLARCACQIYMERVPVATGTSGGRSEA